MAEPVRMLICYYSRTAHTQHMAEAIAEGAAQVEGVAAEVRPISQIDVRELLDYDAILLGSPTYYGTMAAEVKQLIDDTIAFHGQLNGKVGGAFASSANVAGGNETTIMDILAALLIHGMVVQGTPTGDHYGPVAIGDLDRRSKTHCIAYGKYMAELTVRLHS